MHACEFRFTIESHGNTPSAPAHASRGPREGDCEENRPPRSGWTRRARARREDEALVELEVPGGTSYLVLDSRGRPELRLARGPVLVEAIRAQGRPHLLLLQLDPAATRLRLNGGPAPRLTLLGVGDRIALGGGPVLCLSRRRSAPVAPAVAPQAGQVCPLCRTAVAEGTLSYHCPCGTLLHAEGPETEAERRLECASLVGGKCPDCGAPIEAPLASAAAP